MDENNRKPELPLKRQEENMPTALMWLYLLIGSVFGIAVALSLNRVLNSNHRQGNLFDDSVNDALDGASSALRLQLELHQDIAVPGVALVMATVWLPFFVIYFLPSFFKAFADDFRKYWQGEKDDEEEEND